MLITLVGSGSGAPPLGPTTLYHPNNAAIAYSDYCSVAVSGSSARFTRSIADGNGFETVNPGARTRFTTNAIGMVLHFNYTSLPTRTDVYNGVGIVLADGIQVASFSAPQTSQGVAAPLDFLVNFPDTSSRLIEVIWPYCASVDFLGVDLPTGASISAPSARAATLLVPGGDSITHGFFASDIGSEWPYLLIKAKGWQMKNMGYGGRICVPSDGSADGALVGAAGTSCGTYLIGYNDFNAQEALVTFQANVVSYLNNWRAASGASSKKLYVITPIYSTNTNTIPLSSYRTAIANALTSVGNALNILVDGLSIMTNDPSRLAPDGIHPNNLGASEIASNLGAIVGP